MQSHLKIKNFVQKLENDLVQEAQSIREQQNKTSARQEMPESSQHCTLLHDGKEFKLPILKGK